MGISLLNTFFVEEDWSCFLLGNAIVAIFYCLAAAFYAKFCINWREGAVRCWLGGNYKCLKQYLIFIEYVTLVTYFQCRQ